MIQIAILYFLAAGFKSVFTLILPFISEDINLTHSQVGILGSLINFMGIFLALPAGYFAAKRDGIKILIATFFLFGLAFLGIGFSNNFTGLVGLFFIAGIGFGIFLPIVLTLFAKKTHSAKRGQQMGNLSISGDIGRIALGSSVSLLVALIGWQNTSFLYGAIAMIIFISMYYFTRKTTVEPRDHTAHDNTKLLDLFKNTRYILINLAGGLDLFASTAVFIFLPFLLIYKGIDPLILGPFAAAYFIGSIAGKTLIGRLGDKFGNRKLFIIAEIIMAMVIVAMTFSSSIVMILSLSIILGGLTKGTVPASLAILTDSMEGYGSYEKAFGLNTLFISIMITLSPIFFGFLSDQIGITVAFIAIAAITLSATIPLFFYPLCKKTTHQKA